MEKLYRLSDSALTLSPEVKILRREEFENCLTAAELFKELTVMKEKAAKEAEEIYKKRYEEGFAAGSAEGLEEYALKVMETAMSAVDSLESLEKQLVEVVIDSVRSVIGSFNDEELVKGIVHRALNAVRGEKRITVRVSPSQVENVRKEFASSLISQDGSSGYLDIISDASLKSTDCIVESSQGVIDASLDLQMKILAQSLRDRVSRD